MGQTPYLSTDPNAGEYLSTDPNAGNAGPKLGPHPEATIGGGGFWEDRGIGGMAYHPKEGAGSDTTREDNSLLGLPPELAAMGALGVGRAVLGTATNAAGRARAGLTAALSQATPVIKYELTKAALTKVGVPEAAAIPLAMVVSGYRKHGAPRARTAASGPVASAPEPVAAAPAAPASPPVAASTAPSTARTPSPTPGVPAEPSSPARAVAGRGAKASAAAAQTLKNLKLTPEEERQGAIWLERGVPPDVILARILGSRQLTTSLKTPTPDAVRRAVDDRNATGYWKE